MGESLGRNLSRKEAREYEQVLLKELKPTFNVMSVQPIRPEVCKLLSEKAKGNKNCVGRLWVNNGITNKRVKPGEIPEGFVPGRF
jgi:hypothetical protein